MEEIVTNRPALQEILNNFFREENDVGSEILDLYLTEKVFDKIQHAFMMKTLKQTEYRKNTLQHNKDQI